MQGRGLTSVASHKDKSPQELRPRQHLGRQRCVMDGYGLSHCAPVGESLTPPVN